jgi:hypothetical protein
VSEIRNCAREDIPAVAALFQKTFRKPEAKPTASLEAHLADVYLDHPWYDPEIAARVHVNGEGRITGFVGVFPGRFEFRGQRLRAAIAGSLMVDDPEADPLAGARLLRSLIKGPQDISISETTNLLSQGLWERLGGSVVTLFSLDWFRVFHPGAAALSLLSERHPSAAILAPAAWIGDRLGDRLGGRLAGSLTPAGPPARLKRDSAPSDSELASAIGELARLVELRPAWSEEEIGWFLGHAASKERYGPVHRTIVRNGKGKLTGCYIYHGRPGGTGRVLQVLSRPDAVEGVVDCLLYDASEAGLSALRGRCTPQLTNALLKRSCIFVHRASTTIHTAQDNLAAAAERGDAMITGLAGESWTRLIGDNFR